MRRFSLRARVGRSIVGSWWERQKSVGGGRPRATSETVSCAHLPPCLMCTAARSRRPRFGALRALGHTLTKQLRNRSWLRVPRSPFRHLGWGVVSLNARTPTRLTNPCATERRPTRVAPTRYRDSTFQEMLSMSVKSLAASGLFILAATLPSTRTLSAQEIIDLPAKDQPLDADFEEVFRVGVMDGESWEMFGWVHEVAFDANGNLYVFDALASGGALPDGRSFSMPSIEDTRVLVFDASGSFVREFGTRGEGPGEFNRPRNFAVMRDGTTVVNDLGHRAYQLYDANGKFLRMVRAGLDSRSTFADPRGGGVFKGDFNGSTSVSISSQGGAAVPLPSPPTSRPVVRMDLGGEDVRADTVVEGWLPSSNVEDVDFSDKIDLPDNIAEDVAAQVRQALGQSIAADLVFQPPFLVGILPDGGIVHSDSSAYVLQITPPDGDEVARIIRRPLQPRPVTPADQRDYRRKSFRSTGTIRMNASEANPSTSTQGFTLEVPEQEFYHEFSVLWGLATTWEGRIWIRRRGEGWLEIGPIDVVTADGQYVGTFPTDATTIPDAFGPNGMAAFVERNELGVASVVVRRLPVAVR